MCRKPWADSVGLTECLLLRRSRGAVANAVNVRSPSLAQIGHVRFGLQASSGGMRRGCAAIPPPHRRKSGVKPDRNNLTKRLLIVQPIGRFWGCAMLAKVDCTILSCPIMSVDDQGELYPVMQDAARESPALGVYTLSAALHLSGIRCRVVDWVADTSIPLQQIVEKLLVSSVVLFSANSMNWAMVRAVATACKTANPKAKLCIGGPHATHFPESVKGSGLFDLHFRGDADHVIKDVYHALRAEGSVDHIRGCADASSVSPEPVNQSPIFEGVPALDIFRQIPEQRFKSLPVETSRGCKFQCSFCSIVSMKNWRGASVDYAVDRILSAYEHLDRTTHGIISIVDDTFTTDHGRIVEMAKCFDEVGLPPVLNFDATVVDLRNQDVVAALGPYTNNFLVGAEVATKNDAKSIKKAATPKLIRDAASVLSKEGMASRGVFSFIIGFPWHTKKDCIEVLDFVHDLVTEFNVKVYLQWYWPMPGSEIWRKLRSEGKVSLDHCEDIGFFLTERWFYGIRSMSRDDIESVDERIQIIKSLLSVSRPRKEGPPLEYSSPQIQSRKWEAKRFAFA